MKRLTKYILPFVLLPLLAPAQRTVVTDSSQPGYRMVIAGAEYKKSKRYQWLWGSQYRKEWTTPVKVPVINLATEAGGLTPLEQGGGRQTLTLRLADKNGKQYVLRSVNKSYARALPPIVEGTFIEALVNDQVATAHPFAALTVQPMIAAAGIYHTNPKIVFVPASSLLGVYNEAFANTLCLFEERPVENGEKAANFGFSEEIKGTENMYARLYAQSNNRVDQMAFVKARLFDMFLGDWGRHDDQWRWAEFDSADAKIYKPIPRDRDQVYTRFNGLFTKFVLSKEELEHLKSFNYRIKNIKKYNFPARYIDRQLTNEITRQQWTDAANSLQTSLTDAVIEQGVKQLPPELFPFSGTELIAKLKRRRDDLVGYAQHYYRYLNKQVEVVGTAQSELFELKQLTDEETQLQLFAINKEGAIKKTPFYSRIFNKDETGELRLYGLNGNDIYRIDGKNIAMKVRVIGGYDNDSVVNHSSSKINYYDNDGNTISGPVAAHFSQDSAINKYNYTGFKDNVGHTIKLPFYSNTRGVHLLAGYTYRKQQWRKNPYAWQQTLRFNYSLSHNAVGADYEGIFVEAIGKWNLQINGRYDQELRNYFYGIGNETPYNEETDYYRFFTAEGSASVSLFRNFGKYHTVTFGGFYETMKVNTDAAKFILTVPPGSDFSVYNTKQFAGAGASYSFLNINHPVVPNKGVGFTAGISHTKNIKQQNRSVTHYRATAGFYIPLSKSFSIAVRTGATTVSGTAEFYQLNWLGGGQNLRGFHRQRFWGKTALFGNNELRWLPDVKTHLFNGKMGLAAFLDNGRVWNPNEVSDKWHMSYGGGFILAPFNRIAIGIFYGISDEDRLLNFRVGRFLMM